MRALHASTTVGASWWRSRLGLKERYSSATRTMESGSSSMLKSFVSIDGNKMARTRSTCIVSRKGVHLCHKGKDAACCIPTTSKSNPDACAVSTANFTGSRRNMTLTTAYSNMSKRTSTRLQEANERRHRRSKKDSSPTSMLLKKPDLHTFLA